MRWAAEKAGQRMRGGQTNIYICKTADTREATFEEGDMAYRGRVTEIGAQFVMTGERIKTNSRVPGSLCETRIYPCQHQKGVVVVWR
jgi:hypothetical protein